MALMTRVRVAVLTRLALLRTRETVAVETFARRATCSRFMCAFIVRVLVLYSADGSAIIMWTMNISRRTFALSCASAPYILRAQQGALHARVKIDTERVIGDIDPL